MFMEKSEKGGFEKDQSKKVADLEELVLLYSGDFLEEDFFVDWCSDERYIYKQKYISILTKIISFHE